MTMDEMTVDDYSLQDGNTLYVHCDVVHPESGEVLAEPGAALDADTPRAQHVLDIAKTYTDHYFTYSDVYGNTAIVGRSEADSR